MDARSVFTDHPRGGPLLARDLQRADYRAHFAMNREPDPRPLDDPRIVPDE